MCIVNSSRSLLDCDERKVSKKSDNNKAHTRTHAISPKRCMNVHVINTFVNVLFEDCDTNPGERDCFR